MSGAMASIAEAGRIYGPEFAKAEAQEQFNAEARAILKLNTPLNAQQISAFKRYTDIDVMSTQKARPGNDHILLQAANEVTQSRLRSNFVAGADFTTTLHVGATPKEINEWWSSPGHEFLLYLGDDKDWGRIITDLLNRLGRRFKDAGSPLLQNAKEVDYRIHIKGVKELVELVEKMSGGHKRIHLEYPEGRKYSHLIFGDSLYDIGSEEFLSYFEKSGATQGYAKMFFPDEFISDEAAGSTMYRVEYTLTPKLVRKAFDKCWPSMLAVAGLIPIEPLEEWLRSAINWLVEHGCNLLKDWFIGLIDTPLPLVTLFGNLFDIIKFKPIIMQIFNGVKDKLKRILCRVSIAWKGGFSNGYDHHWWTWAQYIKKRRFYNKKICIDWEVISRVGEMYLLKFYQSDGKQDVVFSHELPVERRTVSLARVMDGYDPILKRIREDCPRFFVLEKDWYKVLKWALAEPIESLDPGVVQTTVNRVRQGLSLNTNILVQPMDIEDKDVDDFVMCVLFEAYRLRSLMDLLDGNKEVLAAYETNAAKLVKLLAKGAITIATGGLAIPVFHIFMWLIKTESMIDFVRYHKEPKIWREDSLRVRPEKSPGDAGFEMHLPTQKRTTPTGCLLCDAQASGMFAKGKDMTNTQEFECKHCEDRPVDLSFTSAELTELVVYVREQRVWHTGKASAKLVASIKGFEDWLDSQAGGGLVFCPKVQYIRGGPGTGKSVIVRELAKALEDAGIPVAITFPFSLLSTDYMNAEMLDGKIHTFAADTTWWTTNRVNVHTMFVDEVTGVREDLLRAMGAYLGVKQFYLVGDDGQTHLDAAAGEGVDPTKSPRWDFDSITTHTLVWNWRNPPWQVKAMNLADGYRMKSKRTDFSKVPKIVTSDEYKLAYDGKIDKEMVFSHISAQDVFGKMSNPDKSVEGAVNMSVRSSQGLTASRVACSASQTDLRTMDVQGQLVVSFSRNREELVYVTPGHFEDEAPSKVARHYGFDTSENIQKIERMPWPEVKVNKKEYKLTPEQIALGCILAEKRAAGHLVQNVNEGEEAKEEVESTIRLQEGDESGECEEVESTITLQEDNEYIPGKYEVEFAAFADREVAVEDEMEIVDKFLGVFSSVYHMCLLDAVVEGLDNIHSVLKVKKVFLKKLSVRRETALSLECKSRKPTSGPEDWEVLEGKFLIPVDEFVLWMEEAEVCATVVVGKRIYATSDASVDKGIVLLVHDKHATIGTHVDVPKIVFAYGKSGKVEMSPFDMSHGKLVCRHSFRKGIYQLNKPDFAGYMPTYHKVEIPTTGSRKWDVIAQRHCSLSSSYALNEQAPPVSLVPTKGSKHRDGTDAYKLISFIDPSGAHFGPALNEAGMAAGPQRTRAITPLWEGFMHQRTSGGKIRHFKPKEYRSFLPGMVNHFNDSPEETLNAAHRLGNFGLKPRLSVESKNYAHKITREAFEKHWFPNFKLDSEEINKVVERAIRDMKVRNYAKRGQAELDKRGHVPLLVVSNKDQVKPIKNEKLNLGKSGQAILQSPAYVAAEFAPWMRSLNAHFKRASKPHFFYDNLTPTKQFNLELTAALRDLPESARYGIADGEEFDSWQNEVTLEIEKEFRRLQGAVSTSIEAYYQIRGPQYFTMFGCFRGRTNYEKGSGFLDTLLGNSTLETVAGTQLFKGVGPMVVAAKGDDYLQAQSGLEVDLERKVKMEAILGMRWNVDISNGGEFCGNTVSRFGCFPSISRATLKAVAAKSRNYLHFTKQQEAYREKVQDILEVGLEECIQANVVAEGKTPDYVRVCFSVLNSLGHIGKNQWEEATRRRFNPRVQLPTARGPTIL
jgi:hypothetical protein